MNKELVDWKKMNKFNLMEQKELQIMEEIKGHGRKNEMI